MDPDDLLDYALGRLDGPRREHLERRIARDPELARRIARLIRNLGRLLDDGRGHRPPGVATSSRPPADSPTRQDSVPRDRSEHRGERRQPDSR